MRLVQFTTEKSSKLPRIGVLQGDVITDCTHEGFSGSLVDLLNQENGLETLNSIASRATTTHLLPDVNLLAPITKPDKVLCVGMNYKEHCNELKLPYPVQPIIFSKFSSTITGVRSIISSSRSAVSNSQALDWEVELVVVIGKKAKQVQAENALDYVFGYTVGQDLTARDWVTPDKNGGQYLLGKTMDTFCPLGPCVVTKDEIPDPHNLQLKTWVNSVLKQKGTTSQMVHRIDELISHLSNFMTLYPGDLIMTGTPSGVGFFRNPREALKAGDLVESENIGKISNRVI